ncbi:MAG: hypothetical protein AB1589_02680 [Cyanobacteriota bacterium]
MLKVSYKITIGTAVYTPGNQTPLHEVRSHSSLDVPANTCRIILGLTKDVTIAPDDAVSVELGDERNQTLVFTGKVSTVDWGIDRVSIYADSSFAKLTSARFNLLYEKSSAGDIVRDIVQNRLKVAVENVESGLQFPVYAIGDRSPAYDHLKTLSQQCGFDFYANVQDKAVFAQYQAAATHDCNYGVNILNFNLDQSTKRITKVEVYGESPSSQGQGQQAYSWLTKQDVKGSAGSNSGINVRRADPTARTQQIADKVAAALLENLRQKQRGSVKVLGTPYVKLGDAVNVSQMPVSQLNGSFKVIGVTHCLNHRSGFYTTIAWEEA